MCKDWRASTGDQLWAAPYGSLPCGLKIYLHGDIQQLAIMAWVAVVVWVAHLFPDISIITRVNHMLARQLLAWWVERVLKTSDSAPWKKATPQAIGHRQGAIDRAGVPRDNPEFALIGVCPPWPAITTGGCRELHLPGVLFYNMYSHLRQLEATLKVRVWPGIDKVQLQHITMLGACPEQLPPPLLSLSRASGSRSRSRTSSST